jgi:hypothetical protein
MTLENEALENEALESNALEIRDQVPGDAPGAREIGLAIPARYNASRILFDNLAKGRGEALALTGPAGERGMTSEVGGVLRAPTPARSRHTATPDRDNNPPTSSRS